MPYEAPAWSDPDLVALFARIDNAGRWGDEDDLGTLNHISRDKRLEAARLVETGLVVSLARPIAPRSQPSEPAEVEHRMLHGEISAEDYLGLPLHQQRLTHLDCVSHLSSHDGRVYNDRRFEEVVTAAGVTHGSIYAQRGGIVSRGVLLDLPGALGLDWLEPEHEVSVADLEAAERRGRVRVGRGDVLVVRGGVEAREGGLGRSVLAPGPGPDAIEWLHRREVAVYAGDMPERVTPLAARALGLPGADDVPAEGIEPTRFPLPLHQIAIPAIGLVLLDFCRVEELAQSCRELRRWEFLFMAAPLALVGGTASPVNPLALF